MLYCRAGQQQAFCAEHRMADSLPLVLLLGGHAVGKASLARQLLQDAQTAAPAVWRIDTRYYSVDVELATSDLGAGAAAQQPPEALLLVCSAGDEASFTACRHWHQAFGQVCEVQLLVLNKWDLVSSSGEPAWVSSCQEWCTEQGFELVQVSTSDSEVDAVLSERDVGQGVRRVVSALQAHLWPGLELKAQAAPEADPAPRPSTPPQQPEAAAHRTQEPLENGHVPGSQLAGPPELAAYEMLHDSDEEASETQALEQALGRAAAMMPQLQQMPDGQRRDAAANLAMQFAQMLGIEGEGLTSSEEEDEHLAESHEDLAEPP